MIMKIGNCSTNASIKYSNHIIHFFNDTTYLIANWQSYSKPGNPYKKNYDTSISMFNLYIGKININFNADVLNNMKIDSTEDEVRLKITRYNLSTNTKYFLADYYKPRLLYIRREITTGNKFKDLSEGHKVKSKDELKKMGVDTNVRKKILKMENLLKTDIDKR